MEGHPKSMCWKKIKVYAQNLFTILEQLLAELRKTYIQTFNTWKNLHFVMNGIFVQALQNHEESGYKHNLDLLFI